MAMHRVHRVLSWWSTCCIGLMAHGSWLFLFFGFLRLFGSDIGRLDNHDVIISGKEVAVGKVMK